jgi:hypothetical protein
MLRGPADRNGEGVATSRNTSQPPHDMEANSNPPGVRPLTTARAVARSSAQRLSREKDATVARGSELSVDAVADRRTALRGQTNKREVAFPSVARSTITSSGPTMYDGVAPPTKMPEAPEECAQGGLRCDSVSPDPSRAESLRSVASFRLLTARHMTGPPSDSLRDAGAGHPALPDSLHQRIRRWGPRAEIIGATEKFRACGCWLRIGRGKTSAGWTSLSRAPRWATRTVVGALLLCSFAANLLGQAPSNQEVVRAISLYEQGDFSAASATLRFLANDGSLILLC